jgi:hypothetical protein
MVEIELNSKSLQALTMLGTQAAEIAKQIKLLDKLIFSEPLRFIDFKTNKEMRMDNEAQNLSEKLETEIGYLNIALNSLKLDNLRINVRDRVNKLIDKRKKYVDKLERMQMSESRNLTLENIDSFLSTTSYEQKII